MKRSTVASILFTATLATTIAWESRTAAQPVKTPPPTVEIPSENKTTHLRVSGYGPALDHITVETLRRMRADKQLVVWLFDQSQSMKDDQQAVRKLMPAMFKELKADEPPLMAVHSFGRTHRRHTLKPTDKVDELVKAIDHIPVDKTGKENVFAAAFEVLRYYKAFCQRSKRRLMLIIVSDESGDDEPALELVVREAKRVKAPIYVLGREAVFGSLYAHVRWRQPETGRVFLLPIRRGPETPFAEALQHDGYRRRYDSHLSGFGPYGQTRLCRETGGLFYLLPHEQENLLDFKNRAEKAAKAMRGYEPSYESRSEYVKSRNRSRFRKAIWDAIMLLNPYDKRNKNLELPGRSPVQSFSVDPTKFGPKIMRRGAQIRYMLAVFESAIKHLETVRPLRANEPSRRWQANYDLMVAQVYWYQIRLFQYGIGLDQFLRNDVKNRPEKHNRWSLRETNRKLVLPGETTRKRFNITAEELKQKHKTAIARLEKVRKDHPGTPWARRAAYEMKRPLGITIVSEFQTPPKKPKKRFRRQPTPPPRL